MVSLLLILWVALINKIAFLAIDATFHQIARDAHTEDGDIYKNELIPRGVEYIMVESPEDIEDEEKVSIRNWNKFWQCFINLLIRQE